VLREVPDCCVVSFEPSPTSLPWLTKTAIGSEFRDRWQIVPKALSHAPGEAEFAIGGSRDALFEGFKSHDRIAGGRSVRVPVSTLDAEWAAAGRPEVSVVKIDVEGAEGLVLDGGGELLMHGRPAVVLEWHHAYLRRFGTPFSYLLAVAERYRYRIFTVPAGIPVDDEQMLAVQAVGCDNFLLMPS
jgi:FkbM family methyltransferase